MGERHRPEAPSPHGNKKQTRNRADLRGKGSNGGKSRAIQERVPVTPKEYLLAAEKL